MKHLNLEQFNLVISGQDLREARQTMVDHILVCKACAAKFRMLNELKQRIEPSRHRISWKYVMGAAAVLFMGLYPYLSSVPRQTEPLTLAQLHAPQAPGGEYLQTLERVRQVNYSHALANWSRETNLLDILSQKQP